MDVLKSVGKAVMFAFAVLLLVGVLVYVTIGLGYLTGAIFVQLPFINEWLTGALPITAGQIPHITAWLAVVSLFIGGKHIVTSGDGL